MNENNTSLIRTTPLDFFLQLGVFATLYVSAISLITLWFTIIEKLFPDPLMARYGYDPIYYSGPMRAAIASLVIIFPVFLILSAVVRRHFARFPEKRELAIRKWLTYLTLFVAGVTVLTDLVVLVTHFLNGDLTSQFLLKVLTVLIIAGAVFAFYFYDLRNAAALVTKRVTYAWIVGITVLVSLIIGFIIIGSPINQRLVRFDQAKINNLQNIQGQLVYNYYSQKGKLPEKLDEMKDDISYTNIPVDPQTQKPYAYQKTGNLTFKLCATFNLPSDAGVRGRPIAVPSMAYPYDPMNETWEHPAGDHCFERTIDPELVPKR